MQNCETCNHSCHCDVQWCEQCENENRSHLGHECKHEMDKINSEK